MYTTCNSCESQFSFNLFFLYCQMLSSTFCVVPEPELGGIDPYDKVVFPYGEYGFMYMVSGV